MHNYRWKDNLLPILFEGDKGSASFPLGPLLIIAYDMRLKEIIIKINLKNVT